MNKIYTSTFKTLHSQYYALVLHLCKGFMKGDVENARDLAQDVFINVWKALPQFRGESSHKTWIYRIAVNTCLLQIRKEKNKVKLPLEAAGNAIYDDTATQQENERMLYQAIGKLEEVDRLIIMLVLEEINYDEIAHIIGITENNLRVKIHRIKSKIKILFDHER